MRIPAILFAGLCLVLSNSDALAQLYVKNPGNVGVGTSTPASKFHVSGKSLLESTNDVLTFNTPTGSYQFLAFNRSGSRNAWMGLDGGSSYHIGIDLPGQIYLQPSSGRVIIESQIDNNIGAGLTLTNPLKTNVAGAAKDWTIYNMNGIYGNSLQFWAYTPSSSSSVLTLGDNGYVGIGTTAPTQKLHVAGTVRATTYIADLGDPWADYVFAANYQLPSLRELESYIKQHHHLPEVPTAEEVKKDGIDLASTQTVLLKKIEELTLYVIEQQKEITALKKEMKQVKKRR